MTAARNLLVNTFTKTKNLKKSELKRILEDKLREFNVKIEDKALKQLITNHTEVSGKTLQLKRP